MSADSFHLTANDGQRIYVRRWIPAAPPRGLVIIAHGMAEHSARYDRVAKPLLAEGFAVWAPDHRGHGRTIPPDETPGHMGEDGFEKTVQDLAKLADQVRELYPGLPLVLMGHSMGSFLIQGLVAARPDLAAAVVLSGSNGKPPPIAVLGRLLVRIEVRRKGTHGVSRLMRKLSFEDFNAKFKPNRTSADWLSRDEKEVDKYVADPLCGFDCSVGTWKSLLDALDGLTSPESLAHWPKDLPIYLASGSKDAVGLVGEGVRRLERQLRAAGLQDVTLVLYEGARHEVYNETNRDEVIAAMVAWVKRATKLGA